jgi:hypothetical protein
MLNFPAQHIAVRLLPSPESWCESMDWLPALQPVFGRNFGRNQGAITQTAIKQPTTKISKNMNTTISFKPDRTAQCLWTEALPLYELGLLEIHRASNIEFNNTTQKWEVQDCKRKVRFFAKSRSACLQWENQNLQPD